MNSDIENNNQTAVMEEEEVTAVPAAYSDPLVLEEMAKAGVLYGRKKSKTNPKMKKYIFASRSGFEVFEPAKILEQLDKAKEFLRETVKNGKSILTVSTMPAAKELVLEFAKKFTYPYVTTRWLGGTLTNFGTISKRLSYYLNLKADRALGKLEKYTKKERLEIDKNLAKMDVNFGGLERMRDLPGMLFVVDPVAHETAVREAVRMKIPVIALANSDADPDSVDYMIPGNTNATASLVWFFKQLEEVVVEARSQAMNVGEKK